MFKRGRKLDNISPLLRVKNVTRFEISFSWDNGTVGPLWVDMSQHADKTPALFGNQVDNYNTWMRLDDYQNCLLKRISTRLDNFQCHRIVTTTIGTGPKAQIHEDKVTFTDPILYFFRDKTGWGQPGAFSKENFTEVAHRKCFRNGKDSWWWSTNFKTKTERLMVPSGNIRTLLTTAEQKAKPRLVDVLKMFGVQPKLYDAEGTDRSFQGIHSMGYGIGRQCSYNKIWFGGPNTTDKITRKVTDFITFDSTTCTSFTMRAYGEVQ